jgi:thiol-disulfide isomerase/thioredoxin
MNRFTAPAHVYVSVSNVRSLKGPAVRIRTSPVVLVLCLSLAGCSLFNKNSGAKAPSRTDPAPASATAPPTFRDPPPAENASISTQANGVFAGQIIDRYNRRPGNVWIRVVDLEEAREQKAAPIEKQSDENGYFTIAGLRPGAHYQLIARVQDGDRLFSGTVYAKPPNPRLVIWVSEDSGSSGTPPVPQNGGYPGKPDNGQRPAATLDAPARDTPPAGQPPAGDPRPAAATPTPSNNSATSPATTIDPLRTAVEPLPSQDILRDPRRPEPANIPSPEPSALPPPPAMRQAQPAQQPDVTRQPQAIQPSSESRGNSDNPPVPYCQLVGRKLVDFALYDQNGRVWEYRKDRVGGGRLGRLVLIDFWSSRCVPCLAAMQSIVELNQKYGPYGLDVVGIAYETGTSEQQVAQIRSVRGRYNVRYPTLLGAGSNCPVRTQFEIQYFPTLILLDENGEIIFRKEGLDARGLQELDLEIHKRLLGSR